MEIITLHNINKFYYTKKFFRSKGEYVVLNNLSFKISKGERVGFIGPNGSGKSTTIKILSGIIRPTSGMVLIDGKIPWQNRKYLSKKMGIIFSNCSQLLQHASVQDSFWYTKTVYGIDKKEFQNRLDFLIQAFEMKDLLQKPVSKLSLGEKMKCEVALGFLHDPEIVFLDEPSIGLDVNAKIVFRRILKDIMKGTEKTLLLTSHDMDDIEDICNRIIVINNGSVFYDGSLDLLKKRYTTKKIIKIYAEKFPTLWSFPGCKIVLHQACNINILVDMQKTSIGEVISSIAAQCIFSNIEIESESLESIIGRVYNEKNI